MKPHKISDRLWKKVGIDLFLLESTNYVFMVDYYSNFFEMEEIENTSATTVIHKIKGQFARHEIRDVVVTDNGPQFACEDFRQFARKWHFNHITTSRGIHKRMITPSKHAKEYSAESGGK
jgi:hypothetical protein